MLDKDGDYLVMTIGEVRPYISSLPRPSLLINFVPLTVPHDGSFSPCLSVPIVFLPRWKPQKLQSSSRSRPSRTTEGSDATPKSPISLRKLCLMSTTSSPELSRLHSAWIPSDKRYGCTLVRQTIVGADCIVSVGVRSLDGIRVLLQKCDHWQPRLGDCLHQSTSFPS